MSKKSVATSKDKLVIKVEVTNKPEVKQKPTSHFKQNAEETRQMINVLQKRLKSI